MQVNEYLKNTGDITLAQEVYNKLISVLNVFIGNRKDGLVLKFEGVNHWNFYDWSPYLDGALHGTEDNPINEAALPVDPDDKFVRLTVFDKRGNRATTSAYFVDELMK